MEATKKRVSRLRVVYLLWFVAFYGAWLIAEIGDDRNWIVAVAATGVAGIIWPPAFIAGVILAIRRRWIDLGVVAGLLVGFLVLSGQMKWSRGPESLLEQPPYVS